MAVLALPAGTLADDVGGQCAYRGESGICVTFGEGATANVNPETLEAIYLRAKRDVERNHGLDLKDLPGPLVHVIGLDTFHRVYHISPRLDGDARGDHGWTEFGTGRITLTGAAVMRHEAFHYILWRTGYANRLNAAHEHPVFDEYRDGQWLPRRAVAASAAASSGPTRDSNETAGSWK